VCADDLRRVEVRQVRGLLDRNRWRSGSVSSLSRFRLSLCIVVVTLIRTNTPKVVKSLRRILLRKCTRM
jgi:hypothetical protein